MNIAIIDDSLEERQLIEQYINIYFKDHPVYRHVDLYENGLIFLDAWRPGLYDLVFLDIYMDEIDGVEIARKIREGDSSCLIVFTTSSTEHAILGFELRAFDYLLKPFGYEKFEKTMELCSKELKKHGSFIEVKESRTNIKILLDEIRFTDYYNHYIQIHTTERVIRSYMRFDTFSPMLLCYPQFLCCYRNCIVNMDRISCFEKNDFIMDSGERVPIFRNNRQLIHQKYADYQFQKLNGEA